MVNRAFKYDIDTSESSINKTLIDLFILSNEDTIASEYGRESVGYLRENNYPKTWKNAFKRSNDGFIFGSGKYNKLTVHKSLSSIAEILLRFGAHAINMGLEEYSSSDSFVKNPPLFDASKKLHTCKINSELEDRIK